MTYKPTPKEIDLLVRTYLGDCGPQANRVYSFVTAVLAKWGQPAQAAEPVALLVRKNSWRDGQWEAAPPNSPSYGLAWANQRVYVYTTPQPPSRARADGFFLLLPQRPKPEAPAGTVGLDWGAYSGAQMLAFGRECSDAAIAAIRTQQPAPSGATEEVENLRKALVYAAFALHDTPQYMLAQGITLIDGDTVRVSRDGWTVEASVNPHRQPAPATQQAEVEDCRRCHGSGEDPEGYYDQSRGDAGETCDGPCRDCDGTGIAQHSPTAQAAEIVPAPPPPPECETEAEKRAFAFGWFKALESERMKADSELEDAMRYRWLCCKFGETRFPCALENWLEHGYIADGKPSIDAAIDAAIKQGEKQ